MTTIKRAKKIVCLANAFVNSKATGGGDQFLMELARRCPKNIQLTIILPKIGFDHYQKAGIKNKNVNFLVLATNLFDDNNHPLFIFIAYLIRGLQSYFMLCKLPSFDAIHTSTDIIADTLPAYLYSYGKHKRIWTARFFHFVEKPTQRKGNFLVNLFSYLLQELSLNFIKKAHLIMIDNPHLLKSLLNKGFLESQIQIHPGGVDINSILKAKPNKQQSEAIFIGRLQPHKGIFDAVKIWHLVTSKIPEAKLIMIGHGTDEMLKKLSYEIKKEKLENKVILKGYIYDRNEIYSYCRSSKLLLFLDHEAGFGLVNAEAMAAGLPVIAYNLPIFGSTFKNGYLVSPKEDLGKVAENTIKILAQKQFRKNLSIAAKKEAKKFDWSLVSKRFYKTL